MAKINRAVKDTPFKKDIENQKLSPATKARLNRQYKGAKFLITPTSKKRK